MIVIPPMPTRLRPLHLAHHLRQHGVPALVGEDGQPTVLPRHGILKRGQDTVDAYCFVFEGCGPAYGGKS